ncbi:MAG: hypothetical protein O3C60_17005 [Planctomycetota bacterium]|nr:hypothetical protein [Planctomycetota bacterium]
MNHGIAPSAIDETESEVASKRDEACLELRIRPAIVRNLFLSLTATWIVIHTFFMVLRYQFGMDHVLGIASVFDLWIEKSVPTWYSSMTLFLCGLLLSLIAWATWSLRRAGVRYWAGLALLFFLALPMNPWVKRVKSIAFVLRR